MWLRAVLWGLVDSEKLAGGVVSLWWGKESEVVSEDRYIFPAARRSSRANYLENGYNFPVGFSPTFNLSARRTNRNGDS